MPDRYRLLLASASPRRRELLAQLELDFAVCPAAVDEAPQPAEAPAAYVRRMSLAKALAVQRTLGARERPAAIVLGADTAVVCAGVMYGKPAGRAEAVRYLRRLSGRTHTVLSAVSVLAGDRCESLVQQSRVTLMALSDRQISAYVATGEPLDKAGGYAIQGQAAAFVTRLEGSYSGVMGLPLAETAQLLRKLGHFGC